MSWMSFDNLPDPLLASTSGHAQIMDLVSAEAELSGKNHRLNETIKLHLFKSLDPTPDLHVMFQLFDMQFFDGKLGGCIVEWSKRMKR